MEPGMFSISRYIGHFGQITLKAMLFAVLQISIFGFPSLVLAQLPTVTIVPGDVDVSEAGPNAGSYIFRRSNDADISKLLYVNIHVTGVAKLHTDYPANGMVGLGGGVYRLTIPADQLTLPYVIKGIQDGIVEGDEIVTFTLTDGDKTYRIGAPETASITIKDYIEGIFKDSFEDP